MARYYPVSPLFWTDDKVQSWPERTRLLALYLLTSEHRNLEGLYRLPIAYVQADLSWSEDEVRGHMATLRADDFAHYDEEAKVVLLPKALKYHTVKSETQIKGAINALHSVPDTALWGRFLDEAAEYAPDLCDRLDPPRHTPTHTPTDTPTYTGYEPVSNGYSQG